MANSKSNEQVYSVVLRKGCIVRQLIEQFEENRAALAYCDH
jgi:hypothetical protein